MIKKENRFDEYAYRIATFPLDETVENVEEGQWVTLNDAGKVVIANAATKKAFMCTGSKRTGRDKVSGRIVRNISFLLGHFVLTVSNFDKTGTYAALTPLTLADNGIVKPAGADDAVVAYAVSAPKDGFLRIIHE